MAAVNEQLLKSLPSWTHYYDKFENSTETNCSDGNGCDDERQKYKLTERGLNKHLADVQAALAYIYKEYRGDNKKSPKNLAPAECTARHFFYYWLRDMLSGSAGTRTDFLGMLRDICDNIRKSGGSEEECKIPCDDLKQENFNSQKILFNFLHDHYIIRILLENSGRGGIEKCKRYIENVKTAKDEIETRCTHEAEKSKDEFCKNFWNGNMVGIQAKLSKLQSTLETAQNEIRQEANQAQAATSTAVNKAVSQAVSNTTTTASISSIIGTLAATTFPFFLYKYKPWSSWFGNHSSGNNGGRSSRRKRRSPESTFDTLTENSSTFDSTDDSSTIGPAADLPENSTVRSAPYSRPSNRNRRTGTSNRPVHENIGYQSM